MIAKVEVVKGEKAPRVVICPSSRYNVISHSQLSEELEVRTQEP